MVKKSSRRAAANTRSASSGSRRRRLDRRATLLIAGLGAAFLLYVASAPRNSIPFDIDESSIAYNAYTIARSGHDEHGIAWPLYFRAFGEYKNPPLIYLLAGLFWLFGPSIGLARMLSATIGFLAALLLGTLAVRTTGSPAVGAIVAATALLTPWLFEVSRLVFEVAVFPLALALVLLAVRRASAGRWSTLDSIRVAASLGLLAYSYTIGRLLGPLLALGLVLFVSRERWRGIAKTWIICGVTMLPMLAFASRHPGALSARYRATTYIRPESTPGEIASEFIQQYVGSFSLDGLLLSGDPNARHHLPGWGGMLAATVVLAALGLVLVALRDGRDPWWRFIIYALAMSAVPNALTADGFHSLRLIALPVLMLVTAMPAVAWLRRSGPAQSPRRQILALLLVGTVVQGALFQWQFHRISAGYRGNKVVSILKSAAALGERPIYLLGAEDRYVFFYWYGVLEGIDATRFRRLSIGDSPPSGAVVIDARGLAERL